ncbi:hypothetical protein ACSNOH_01320 [Streptomyces sp. URMC 127]
MMDEGSQATQPTVSRDDLSRIASVYGLGEIVEARYLADGLMNRNWCLRSARGSFALKEIVDIRLR